MKRIKHILILSISLLTFTSCLEEVLPQNSEAISKQIEKASKMGFVNGLVQYLNTPYNSGYSYDRGIYTEIGYPEHMIWRDIMTDNMPIRDDGADYWNVYEDLLYVGNYGYQSYYFWYYNKLLYMATSVIAQCDKENEEDAFPLANGCAFRAYFNMVMTRMYEFRETGVAGFGINDYPNLKGLTLPIVNEYTTEAMAGNNPRVPFYEMYRYILGDLNMALDAIRRSGTSQPAKNYASEGMINGLLAQFWLEVATRFENNAEDLALQIAHDEDQWEALGEGYQNLPPLGIESGNLAAAFQKAADYADAAIACGYTPLTESQWYNTSTGFNSANNSWMWGILMSPSDPLVVDGDWMTWVSYMSPEAGWGISGAYAGQFMIDRMLYESIPESDWRRLTWIDPADLPKIDDWSQVTPEQEAQIRTAYNTKYAVRTNLEYEAWKKCAPYVGFKFHPGSGNIESPTSGNKVDIPLMRVEEMYFIKAEALEHITGGDGARALEEFISTYRDPLYKCTISNKDENIKEIIRQKRIEFWGEGIVLFDYKRLGLPIERGYTGSNHKSSALFNSKPNAVAPWTILFIPVSERNQNPAFILNPDPTNASLGLKYKKQ